jgi:hypothetical protein
MSTQLTPHAAYGLQYRLAMTAPARAAALKAKKVTAKGVSVAIGMLGVHPYVLDMTASQFEQFKSTFGAKTDE